MLPYRSILVTGAGGFVGGYLIEALRRSAPDARLSCPGRAGGTRDDAEPFDVRDPATLARVMTACRPDLVVHLAAQSSVAGSLSGAAETWRTNVCGTLNLAQAVAAIVPTATFAFASSSEIYGAAFNAGMVDEDTAPAPLSAYARTKRAGEDLLHDALAPGNRCVIFRPSNHSGAGQDPRFVLPSFADQIAAIEAGRAPAVVRVGSLTAKRDFLDVRDVVDAYVRVLASNDLPRFATLNVASGRTWPISYLLEELLDLARVPVTIEEVPERLRPNDIPKTQIDATKLRDLTGWNPNHLLRETIADVLDDRRRQMALST